MSLSHHLTASYLDVISEVDMWVHRKYKYENRNIRVNPSIPYLVCVLQKMVLYVENEQNSLWSH